MNRENDGAPNGFFSWLRQHWQATLAVLVVAVLYGLPLAGAPAINPNEVVRIELSASVAFWARLDLGNAAEVYGLSEDVSIHNRKIYSDKAPGLSVVATPVVWLVNPILARAQSSILPAYWPLRHALTLLLVALPAVGLALLIGVAVPNADPDRRIAFAVIAALATPLWTYATVFFGHVPAALLVTAAWFLLLGLPDRPTDPDAGRAVLGGAAAGFAVATEYPTVLLVAIIFVTLLVRRTALPILAAAAGGALFGVLPALVYHDLAFGSPWLTGYAMKAQKDFQVIHQHGIFGVWIPTIEALWGVLFGARRGVFYYCPLLLLTPLGLWGMVRKAGWRDAGPIVTAIVAYVLFAAGFVDWTAGWCAAARHLVPIIPLGVAVALLAAVKLATRRWGGVIVVILIAVSGVNAVLTIALTPFFPPEFGAPLAQLVLPSLADGAGFANVVSAVFGVAPVAVVTITSMIAIAALIWASGRLVHGRRWWLPIVSLMTVAGLVLVLTWQGSASSAEVELMRAQVLRRLGHISVADRIEDSLFSADMSPQISALFGESAVDE